MEQIHNTLNFELIDQASSFLRNKIHRTPLEFSSGLSKLTKVPTYLKMESQQVTGSFKVRGALFYVSTLNHDEHAHGIAACSAGNHGLGVAYAAMLKKIPCTIYVPKHIEETKEVKIQALGARVIKSSFIGYDETLSWAMDQAHTSKQHFISAFDDARIMAANGGTIAREIFEDLPDVAHCFFPVGGGGLGAGLAYYFHCKNPTINLVGCQLAGSPALLASMQKGKVIQLPPIKTIAGGLEGAVGEHCFEILKERIAEVSLVQDQDLMNALIWMLSNHQLLTEPSALAGIASCLKGNHAVLQGPTVIVLTGRNISFSNLTKIISEFNEN